MGAKIMKCSILDLLKILCLKMIAVDTSNIHHDFTMIYPWAAEIFNIKCSESLSGPHKGLADFSVLTHQCPKE